MEDKILLSIQLRNDDIVKKIAETKESLIGLKVEAKLLNAQLNSPDIKAGSDKFKELTQTIVLNEAEQRKAKQTISALNKEFDNNIKITNAATKSNEQLRAMLSVATAQLNAMGEAERTTTDRGKELEATVLGLSTKLKKNEAAVGDNRRKVGDYTGGILEAIKVLQLQADALDEERQALEANSRALEDQIANYGPADQGLQALTAELDRNTQNLTVNAAGIKENASQLTKLSADFQGAANTVAGMEEKLTELKATSKTLDLDSPEYAKISQEMSSLALKIGQATGKLDEFGNREPKNPLKKAQEDAIEAATAVTSTIALMNVAFGESVSLQELQAKSLQAMAIAQNVANVAKAKGAIVDTAAIIKTKAATASQAVYTAVVGASTGAVKALKLAVAGLGFGAVIAGVGLLIANWKKLTGQAEELTEAQKELNALRKESAATEQAEVIMATKRFEYIKETISGTKERELGLRELNKEYGTSLKNLENEAAFLRQVNDAQNEVIQGIQRKIRAKLVEEELTAAIKEEARLNTELSEKLNERIDLNKILSNEEIKSSGIFQEDLEDNTDAVVKLNSQLKAQKKIVDDLSGSYLSMSGDRAALDKLAQEEAKKEAERLQKEREKRAAELKAEAKDRFDAEKVLNEAIERAKIELINDDFERQRRAIEYEAQIQAAALQDQLKNIEGTDAQKVKLTEQTNERIRLIEEKAAKDIEQLASDHLDKLTADEVESSAYIYTQKMAALVKEQEQDIKFADATIKKKEELERAKLEIVLKSTQAQLEATRSFFLEDGSFGDEELLKLQEITNTITGIQEKIAAMPELKAKNWLGLTEEDMGYIQQAGEFLNTAISSAGQIATREYENRRTEIDQRLQAELNAIDKSTLSEEKKAKKKEALEQKAAMDAYKIQKEQFEVNKGMSIAQAGIGTALAVMQALSSLPPPASFIAAAIAGVAGAVQIGLIASEKAPPPPQFFDGGFTEKSGNPRRVSRYSNSHRILHHEEYVAPKKVLQLPQAQVHIAALEMLRTSTAGSLNMAGYADGGFVARSVSQDAMSVNMPAMISQEVAQQMSKVKIVTMVSDINRAQGDVILNTVEAVS